MTIESNRDSEHTITAADGTVVPVPQEFICPLTLDIMVEPLLSQEGHNYDREAILRWVAEHGTSPLTRSPLRLSQLLRNRTLETRIRFFMKRHGVTNDAVVSKDDNASRFMGYIVDEKKKRRSSMAPMSLSTLATFQVSRPRTTEMGLVLEDNGPTLQDYRAERRRQIVNLIDSAMQEFDNF